MCHVELHKSITPCTSKMRRNWFRKTIFFNISNFCHDNSCVYDHDSCVWQCRRVLYCISKTSDAFIYKPSAREFGSCGCAYSNSLYDCLICDTCSTRLDFGQRFMQSKCVLFFVFGHRIYIYPTCN